MGSDGHGFNLAINNFRSATLAPEGHFF